MEELEEQARIGNGIVCCYSRHVPSLLDLVHRSLPDSRIDRPSERASDLHAQTDRSIMEAFL